MSVTEIIKPYPKRMRAIHIVLFFVFFIVSCGPNTSGQYKYEPPKSSNDGLNTGHLNEVGMDSVIMGKAIKKAQQGKFRQIHSILIYKDNTLVLEEYFPGHKYQWDARKHEGEWVNWDRNMLHSIMSDTKSITSVCIGIAIDQGFIKSVHQSIFDYLPEHQHLRTGDKSKITIEHLLTMTSGLEWSEWQSPYSNLENPIIAIWYSKKDPLSFILEGQLVHEPGTSYSYYGGNMIILGEIIRNATKMAIDEFSAKYLFDPLGIEVFDWSVQFNNGVFEAAGGLRLKPRDMLKIGITFLHNGVWKGNRIISEQWVEKITTPFHGNTAIKVPGEDSDKIAYSYSWWIDQFSYSGKTAEGFYAGGWGGQKIIVIPKLNTVVVFTGGNYTSKLRQFKLLEKYILPSMS
ncbi:serine hydrolase domain-containing protein [Ulvibacterium marinum]|nr:serine hydrolase [Ulvibacterium marinum]